MAQKLLNDPADFVDETIDGIVAAHPDQLCRATDPRVLVRASPPPAKVGIVTGGGSGHLPLFLGYVGEGLADAVAVGNVFSSPSAEQILHATVAADQGAGVLHLFGHYSGDRMNAELAAELAAAGGIDVATILGSDDVASAPREQWRNRRGVAGIVFLYKVAGAAAAEGRSLAEVVAVTTSAAADVATMSVGLSPCSLPAVGRPTFDLAAGEMEIGVGLHGEPGVRRAALERADAIAEQLVDAVVQDLALQAGEDVAALVNGLGATPQEELYILYRRVHALLDEAGISVGKVLLGEYATSLEMGGASLSLLRLDDDRRQLLAAPARSPFFQEWGR